MFALFVTLAAGMLMTSNHPFPRSVSQKRSPIPEFSLSLTCGSSNKENPYQVSENERRTMVQFVNFMRRNREKVVYVNVRIRRECDTCMCARAKKEDSPKPIALEDHHLGRLYIDARTVEERKKYFSGWGTKMNREGIELMMFAPNDWGVGHSVFLPRQEHLSHAQYRFGELGSFIRFDGLFSARFKEATGGNSLELDTLSPTDEQQRLLQCIRDVSRPSSARRDDSCSQYE